MNAPQYAQRIHAALASRGFRRRANTWNRRIADLIDVVNLQKSKSGERVTVNLGVTDTFVYQLFNSEEPRSFIIEPHCTVRTRLGLYIGPYDQWWRLDDQSGPEKVAMQISSYGLQFFEQMHELAGIEEFIEKGTRAKSPPEVIYLGLLALKRGDREKALEVLNDFCQSNAGPWADRTLAIIRRVEKCV